MCRLGWIPVHDLQAPSQLASPSPGPGLHSAGHPKCTSPQTSGIFGKEPTSKAIKRISGASLIYKDRKKDNKMQSLIFEETEPGSACRRRAKRPHRSPALAHYVSSGLDAGTRCARPLAQPRGICLLCQRPPRKRSSARDFVRLDFRAFEDQPQL